MNFWLRRWIYINIGLFSTVQQHYVCDSSFMANVHFVTVQMLYHMWNQTVECNLTLVVRLGVKSLTSVLCHWNFSSVLGGTVLWFFSEYDCGTKHNSYILDRCTGSCFACRQTHTNYFETVEILRSCWLIQPSASNVSILAILAAKAKHFTTTNWKKVSTDKCNIDGQP